VSLPLPRSWCSSDLFIALVNSFLLFFPFASWAPNINVCLFVWICSFLDFTCSIFRRWSETRAGVSVALIPFFNGSLYLLLGRGQETPGEDPYVTGLYAANFVTGMQEGEDMSHLKVSSCCKHYFDYKFAPGLCFIFSFVILCLTLSITWDLSNLILLVQCSLENWHGVDRHHFNAISSDQDIADTYLPAFESCIRLGRVSGLMCSCKVLHLYVATLERNSYGFRQCC